MAKPRGFVPYRSTGASLGGGTRRYHTRAKNAKQIFVNDIVCAVSGATGMGVTPFVPATDGTAAAAAILGVVQGIYDANGKPYTFSQPTNGPMIPTATNAYVDVNIDPNQTYLVRVHGTASGGTVGRYLTIDTTAQGTAMGMSPMMVSTATTTNALRVPVTGDQTPFTGAWPLYCIGVEPWEDSVDHNPLIASYEGVLDGFVEVKINNMATTGYVNNTLRLAS